MQRRLLFVLCYSTLFAIPASASELIHQFNSPSFSGQGFSSHALTIYNMEQSAKNRVKDEQAAEQARKEALALNDPVAKFMANVESRIYASIAKQLTDKMFGNEQDGVVASPTGSVTLEGTTISYVKAGENVAITIIKPNGSSTTITMPLTVWGF